MTYCTNSFVSLCSYLVMVTFNTSTCRHVHLFFYRTHLILKINCSYLFSLGSLSEADSNRLSLTFNLVSKHTSGVPVDSLLILQLVSPAKDNQKNLDQTGPQNVDPRCPECVKMCKIVSAIAELATSSHIIFNRPHLTVPLARILIPELP